MLKKTMTTVDFGGTERTEDYYFNLTRAEIMEMELTTEGGLVQMINRITAAQSQLELAKLFKQIICKSYGVLSPDGRKFIKNDAVLADFMSTQAYSDLYYKLASNGEAAAAFFEGILPEDMKEETKKVAPVNAQPGLKVLEDDLGFFPPYYAVNFVNADLIQSNPALAEVLSKLDGAIDEATMAAMNAQVDVDGMSAKEVAHQFLVDNGLIPA